MKDLIILTPFSRPQNIPALVKMLEPQGVTWIPICHDLYHATEIANLKKTWIKPVLLENVPPAVKGGIDVCYHKLNLWIERRENIPLDTHIMVLCDDDGIEPDFAAKLRAGPDADVIFVSVDAGDVSTVGDNGCKHNAKIYQARNGEHGRCVNPLESYLVRWRVLRDIRWHEHDGAADGQMGAQLYHMRGQGFGYSVGYRPDVFSFLNFLQAGRFNNKRGW